jgi:Zn finger protein HypA/HybF involved in hydrogenase expression
MPIYQTYKCQCCNKTVTKANSRGKYCSTKCQMKHKRELSVLNNTAKHRSVKRYLEETVGNKCNTCGLSEWNEKELVLEIEHKDGNSENNHLDNVELLCPNCHSQTKTYKNRNKGNGRYVRRQRYQQNLSY